ncbi:MAG: hypothetical protein K5905_24290 [Roseibium sp.]|uniref:hypothetical protein n=1 Tax=Roseibium sp. TaxID=1936156 RepID=UPI0026228014|nr:hypothetical protein [Roseibium sp.]MCV0428589.1 hypothetical protein [Roseibium sp.]
MTPQASEPVVLRAEGDHYLDPWLTPQSDTMQGIITEAIYQLEKYEKVYGLRKRKRKTADQASMEQAVTALICAATVHLLSQRPGGLKVSRSHRTLRKDRYKTPIHSSKLGHFLNVLIAPEIPWLNQVLGVQTSASNAPVTTITAGERLINRIQEHGITREDVIRGEGGELIELREPKGTRSESRGKLMNYPETNQTCAWRRQMQEINRFLMKAELSIEGAVGTDIWDRRLRRVFNNGDLEQGGRLYGGFWQPMRKAERFRHLRIDDKPVIELDYGQVATTILYGRNGLEVPEGDLYAIEGKAYPRKGMKKVLNALLYTSEPLTTWPKDTVDLFRDPDSGEHPPFRDVKEALIKKHSSISSSFETGEGMRIMFLESQILIDVLETLRSEGITALPIHDAILVAKGHEGLAKKVMVDSFLKVTGVTPKVTLEYQAQDS